MKQTAEKVRQKCVLCGKELPKHSSKYCGMGRIDGVFKDKTSCKYKAWLKRNIGYLKTKKGILRYKRWVDKTRNKNPNHFYKNYKNNSKYFKRRFELSYDEFLEFWQKPCFYCGDKIETIGLDRMNNEIGYKKSNIVSCCKRCNFAKGYKLSKKEFINLAVKIAKNHSDEKKE